MTSRPNGISLVEVLMAVVVVSLCVVGLIKLMSTSQVSLTQSIGSLKAQASAEDLLQQIRLMRWDNMMSPTATAPMPLTGPVPTVTCGICTPPRGRWNTGITIRTWTPPGPPYGTFQRTVRVRFVDIDPTTSELIPVAGPTHRKRGRGSRVTAVGRTSTATVTSVFYNLP
jgi:Tfp pilus assembly protein PilV